MDQFQSRKLQIAMLVLLSTLLLIVSACAAPATAPAALAVEATVAPAADVTTADDPLFPLTITDAVGQEFTFDAPPKLGCWWAGCTEMLADLGVVAHAAAYDEETGQSVFLYPDGVPAENIADTANPELWAAAAVDLLLMRVPDDPARDPLKAAAPIFYLHHPAYGESAQSGYQAFVENLHLLGQLTERPAEADAAIARFMTVMDNLRALATPVTAAQTVAVLFQGEEYRMIGPGNPFCVALAEVGLGQCVGEGDASYELNAEEFLNLDPDWLVYQLGDGSYADRTDPVWSQLTAVKEGRVYDAKNHRYYCCSLRGLILALQEFAHYTLPEANIPDPGPWLDFDPLQSPLFQPSEVEAALFPLTITDAAGQAFTFDAPPKIGCYWYGCIEAFADLGVPFYAGTLGPEELASVFYAPAGPPTHLMADDSNPENWAAAEVDLFVTRVPDSADLDAMRQAAPIFFLHHPSYGPSDQQGYAAYYQNLRLLGALVGQPEAAEAAITRFETVLANLKALSTPKTEALTLAVLFSGEGYPVMTPDNPFCDVVTAAGLGHCVGEGAPTLEVNAESFLALDPDWIIYAGFGQSYQERSDPVWGQLTAVKEGRVYDAAGSRYYCCSTRGLINALQDYVSHLLPDAGIPNPGSELDFDPLQSPLVQP